MPGERTDERGLAGAMAATDWTQYAGRASAVKRRGERRRRGLQVGGALGTTLAVLGVAVAVHGSGAGSAARQGAMPAASVTPGPSPQPPGYPSFPEDLPSEPLLIANPGRVLASGAIGAGEVSGHRWQLSYRVIPSASAANGAPQVHVVDVSLDGKVVSSGSGDGPLLDARGYQTLDQQLRDGGIADPMIVASGTPSPGVTSVDLRWGNGTVVQVPIRTVTGTRFASFAWDPANPPEALEQVGPTGVQKITITRDESAQWGYDARKATPTTPASPPGATPPTGVPNLSRTPHVTPLASGILGAGTVSGHAWQLAYEIIPSGSSGNVSDKVFCTDTTVDGVSTQGGCTSSDPCCADAWMGFAYHGPGQRPPIVADFGHGEPGTASMGLEWADGTKTVTTVTTVEGTPIAALAFDPGHPPSYLLEFGSYGEYRLPLTGYADHIWTFDWPNR